MDDLSVRWIDEYGRELKAENRPLKRMTLEDVVSLQEEVDGVRIEGDRVVFDWMKLSGEPFIYFVVAEVERG